MALELDVVRKVTILETLAGFALLLLGVVIWQTVTSTLSAANSGSYALGGGAGQTVWRINTVTGDMSICRPKNFETAPVCSPWGGESVSIHGQRADAEKDREARFKRATDQIDALIAAEKAEKGSISPVPKE